MINRTRAALLASAVALTLAVSACSGSPAPTETTDPADATLTVGLVLEPTDLDIRHTSGIALDQVLIDNVYEGLVSRQPDGSIVDNLAAKHTVSDDGLTYTFTLNDGIVFHDKTPVTSANVVESINEVREDESINGHDQLASVSDITAPDEKTVVITLGAPDSQLLWNLSGRAGLVLPPTAGIKLSETAIGTGPFRLEDWRQGDSLTLGRFDDYWGERAAISEVTFTYIPDPAAAVNAVIAGDVDVQTAVDATLAPQIEGTDGYTIASGKTTDKYTLAFNNGREPLTDPRVRKALRQAIDHTAIIESIGGAGVAQGGPIPALDPGYEDLTDIAPYDPAAARALLAEAGQDSIALTLTIPNIYPDTLGTVLTSQFKEVGVELTVRSVEFASWLNDVYTNKDYDLSLVNHAEAHDFGNWANPGYYFAYDNPAVVELYKKSIDATDPAEADAALAEAARIVSEDNAADWLYTATTLTAIRDGVSGFPTDSTTARLNLGTMTVDE